MDRQASQSIMRDLHHFARRSLRLGFRAPGITGPNPQLS